MTFASAEAAYLDPPEPFSCERCEDDPKLTHDDCLYTEADAAEDAAIARAEWAAEGEDW